MDMGMATTPWRDMGTIGAELGFRMGTVSSGNALDAPGHRYRKDGPY